MFDWFRAGGPGDNAGKIKQQIQRYVKQACSANSYYPEHSVKQTPAGKALLDYPAEQLIPVLFVTLETYIKRHKQSKYPGMVATYSLRRHCQTEALQQLLVQLLRRKLPYDEGQLQDLFKLANNHWKIFMWYRPHNALLGVLERCYPDRPLPEAIAKEVRRTIKKMKGREYDTAEDRKLVERARRLLGEGTTTTLNPDFAWSRTIIAELAAMPGAQQQAWQAMLEHAQTAQASKAGKKWLETARGPLLQIGEAAYAQTLCHWLQLIQQEKYDSQPLNDEVNATVVRGLLWAATLVSPEAVAGEVKQLAIYCFRKITYVGAVSTRVGNACLYVLGQLPGLSSVTLLSELLQKIKYPSARALVEKALDAAAARNNMSREELVEISVPGFGLDAQGELHKPLGDVTAVLRIEPGQKVSLLWQKADGKRQKTVPATIKESFADDIQDLKKRTREMRTTLQAQVARIETCFLKPEPWTYRQWCERYRDHPLLQHIADKLIWQLQAGEATYSVMPLAGQLYDQAGEVVEVDVEQTQVRLWHPVSAEMEAVLAWRRRIDAQQITQPFKQAHREVYLLTDAERATEQYSNRFAAHILKQHQLNALCQQRGWQYSLQGNFDSWNAPSLSLPQWHITAEFYVDGVESSENEMGIFNYIASDQVRFMHDGVLLRLEEVPPIIFSEVMRDVDLFIGVCSIGNDPGWQDSGIHVGFNDYWREYAFGELLESARVRKEVLENLLPKLKIAGQCEIRGRFLKIKGQYRTYKIHLGSGNILMEPNDQYLCIVEGRSTDAADTRRLVLPFEGDHRLSVILSKAFLLANDGKITDRTILNQIKR